MVKRGERALTLISPLKLFNLKSPKGFTLVEILIVLAIFAGIAAMGIPALFKKSDNIKKVARQLTSLTKEVRNRAKLKNSTYRIVFDMTAEPHRYWVEFMQGSKPIPANLYESKKDNEAEGSRARSFQKDTSLMKKERELPNGLTFASIETINTKTPISEGLAYVHYFPEGFVEAAVIQVTNKNNLTWSFVISPLTGQCEIIEEAKSLKDLNQ